jgi:hypothetical protein
VKCRPRPGPRHRIAYEPDTGSHATFAPGRDGPGTIPPSPDEIWWLSFTPGTVERYVAALTAADETEAAVPGADD